MTPERAERNFQRLMDDLREDVPTMSQLPAVNLDEYAVSVRNTLGLPKEKWDAVKIRSLNELGKFLALKITARVLLVTTFDNLNQLEKALEVGAEMMNREPGKITDEDRIAAGKMMALCANGLKELKAQAMELAEKGLDEGEKPSGQQPPKPPRNKPPNYRGATLVNAQAGSQVLVQPPNGGDDRGNNGTKLALPG